MVRIISYRRANSVESQYKLINRSGQKTTLNNEINYQINSLKG